jgi:hypothetical protein
VKYKTLRIPAKNGNEKGSNIYLGKPVAATIRTKGMAMIAAMIKVHTPTIILSMIKATSLLIQ